MESYETKSGWEWYKNKPKNEFIKKLIIHRPPVFSTFFKNTQFFFFAVLYLKLTFFSLVHSHYNTIRTLLTS